MAVSNTNKMALSNTKWSEEDERRLADLFDKGISLRRLAEELKRTPHAVQCRIEVLGLGVRRRRDKSPGLMVSSHAFIKAESPVVSLSAAAEALIEQCYSEMLAGRTELRRRYKLKEKPKKAIGALFKDLLRSFRRDGSDRRIKVSTTKLAGIRHAHLKAFVHYLESERLLIRVDAGSILDSTRGDQAKRLLMATTEFANLCARFGIDPENVEIHFRI
jgi:hypothetical protein